MTPEPVSPSALTLLLIGAFFMGALPFGFWAGKLRGVDLREQGSGNIGATNTLRVLGPGPGVTVLLLDALKGFLPVWAAQSLLQTLPLWFVLAGLCAVLGHTYSPFVRFKGGKGVATSLGVLLALSPVVALCALAAFVLTVAVSRYVSLGSIVGAVTEAALFWILPHPLPLRVFGLLVAFFVIVRHRANIARLRAGTESRFGTKKTETAPASEK